MEKGIAVGNRKGIDSIVQHKQPESGLTRKRERGLNNGETGILNAGSLEEKEKEIEECC